MKALPTCFALLGLVLPLTGQERADTSAIQPTEKPVFKKQLETFDTISQSYRETGKARVLGKIPDGSPPPPAEPELRIQFTPQDVLASREVIAGDRRIVFEKVAPIQLPSPPAPALLPDPADPLIAEQTRNFEGGNERDTIGFCRSKCFQVEGLSGAGKDVRPFLASTWFGIRGLVVHCGLGIPDRVRILSRSGWTAIRSHYGNLDHRG